MFDMWTYITYVRLSRMAWNIFEAVLISLINIKKETNTYVHLPVRYLRYYRSSHIPTLRPYIHEGYYLLNRNPVISICNNKSSSIKNDTRNPDYYEFFIWTLYPSTAFENIQNSSFFVQESWLWFWMVCRVIFLKINNDMIHKISN